MKYIITFLLILVFILINLKFNIEKFQGDSDMDLAKSVLKNTIFNNKKCLTTRELRNKINNQLDKYLKVFSAINNKKKVCLSDIERFLN